MFRALARVPGTARMFFKFQRYPLREIELLQSAAPATPWVYLYRNAVEVLVFNFRSEHA